MCIVCVCMCVCVIRKEPKLVFHQGKTEYHLTDCLVMWSFKSLGTFKILSCICRTKQEARDPAGLFESCQHLIPIPMVVFCVLLCKQVTRKKEKKQGSIPTKNIMEKSVSVLNDKSGIMFLFPVDCCSGCILIQIFYNLLSFLVSANFLNTL